MFIPILGIPACLIYLSTILTRAKKYGLQPAEKRWGAITFALLIWNVYEFWRDYHLIREKVTYLLNSQL